MDLTPVFCVEPLEPFTPQMGHLVSQMNYARQTTLRDVQDLSVEQLDYLIHPKANSVGMLLEHMAAVEVWYQLNTFEKRHHNEEEIKRWTAGSELGDYGRGRIRANSIDYYLTQLETVRTQTLRELAKRDDDWLYEEEEWNVGRVNNYWKWFHVFEDELNHRGQIRLIINSITR